MSDGQQQRREARVAECLIDAARAARLTVAPGAEAKSADEWGRVGFRVKMQNGQVYRVSVQEEATEEQ